jgi:serralysin
MSYRCYIGASTTQGLTNASWSFPQTLMMDDIAALQYMYGANYTTNNGDTVYKWNPATGQETINGVAQAAPGGNTIFMTVWDGGGNDTYDFSNYTTNVTVNLQPGSWTTASTAQLAYLGGGHYAAGNIANSYLFNNNPASLIENAVGGSGNDSLTGNTANNKLTGGAGNDTLDGVSGTDTAIYSGPSDAYQVTQNADGSWQVVDLRTGSPDGTDTLKNIEYLQFANTTLAIGPMQPPAGQTSITSAGSTQTTTVSATTSSNALTGTAANEVLFGNGGNNTFVFTGKSGKDSVIDFHADRDVLQFKHTVFTDVADALAHSAQMGSDVTITVDAGHSVTLSNTVLSQLNAHNVHLV